MFKKKTIYIVGVVIFTLLLVADLAVLFLVPTQEASAPSQPWSWNAGDFEGVMPEGLDQDHFQGQFPQGSFGTGDFTGQRPQMDTGATRPSDMESWEDFGSSFPQAQANSSQTSSVWQTLRRAVWPIAIICILADAVCVIMLIVISKRKAEDQAHGPGEEETSDAAHRASSNIWLGLTALLVVAAVVFTSLPSGDNSVLLEAQAAIVQAQVEKTDIASVVSGSGTLSSSQAWSLEVPSLVTVNGYTVKNGDTVQSGDMIALVDETSVEKAIYEVQALIRAMDEEIAQVHDDTLDTAIAAPVGGRIKALYVQAGDAVADVMYDRGALLLISLGGSMTVEIQSQESLAVGQTLLVTLSDGTAIEGKVQQLRDGAITVTTTDDGPVPGDSVSVFSQEGKLLGSGELEVSSPLKITGYSGKIERVRVKVGDVVEAGDTLITLEDLADTARYQQLLLQRQELTELMAQLNAMLHNGGILAEHGGLVSQIPEDGEYVQLSANTAVGVAGGASYGTRILASPVAAETSPAEATPTETAPPETTPTETVPPETPPTETAPSETPDPGEARPEPEQHSDGSYAGKITKVSYGAILIQIQELDITGTDMANLETMEEELFTALKQYAPELDIPIYQYQNGQSVPSTIHALQAGDRVMLRVENGSVVRIDYIAATAPTIPGQGSHSGGTHMPSMGSGMGGQQSQEEENQATYEVEKQVVCAIIPSDVMAIQVSVDELDILSLTPGQTVAITLDALPGQSFEGCVKRIDHVGVNAGGSTKYTVTMEVPRTSQMLESMNASVKIQVGCQENVLSIPAAAVCEDGNRTYVYTGYDDQREALIDPVDITTGASDGNRIQVLSGLEELETVYYRYADSVVYLP